MLSIQIHSNTVSKVSGIVVLNLNKELKNPKELTLTFKGKIEIDLGASWFLGHDNCPTSSKRTFVDLSITLFQPPPNQKLEIGKHTWPFTIPNLNSPTLSLQHAEIKYSLNANLTYGLWSLNTKSSLVVRSETITRIFYKQDYEFRDLTGLFKINVFGIPSIVYINLNSLYIDLNLIVLDTESVGYVESIKAYVQEIISYKIPSKNPLKPPFVFEQQRILGTPKVWFEAQAIDQVEDVKISMMEFKGIEYSVGMDVELKSGTSDLDNFVDLEIRHKLKIHVTSLTSGRKRKVNETIFEMDLVLN